MFITFIAHYYIHFLPFDIQELNQNIYLFL